MMERADRVPELLRDVDHLRHLVRAVAVIVDENVAPQHLGERLQSEIARGRLALMRLVPPVPLTPIPLGADPCLAISCDVPHSRRGAAAGVYTFGILAAGHLQPVPGAGK